MDGFPKPILNSDGHTGNFTNSTCHVVSLFEAKILVNIQLSKGTVMK